MDEIIKRIARKPTWSGDSVKIKGGVYKMSNKSRYTLQPVEADSESVDKCPICGRQGDDRIEECYFFTAEEESEAVTDN